MRGRRSRSRRRKTMTCLQGHARPRGRGWCCPRTRITVLTDGFESGRVRKHRPVEPPTFGCSRSPNLAWNCLEFTKSTPAKICRIHTHRRPFSRANNSRPRSARACQRWSPRTPPAPATPQPNFTGSPRGGFALAAAHRCGIPQARRRQRDTPLISAFD